jgi:hypothetical protein
LTPGKERIEQAAHVHLIRGEVAELHRLGVIAVKASDALVFSQVDNENAGAGVGADGSMRGCKLLWGEGNWDVV